MRIIAPFLIILFLFSCQEAKTSSKEKITEDSVKLEIIKPSSDTIQSNKTSSEPALMKKDSGKIQGTGQTRENIADNDLEYTPGPDEHPAEDKSIPGNQKVVKESAGNSKVETGIDSASNEEKKIHQSVDEITNGLHDDWDRLLKQYVSPAGYVDYKGIKSQMPSLESYLNALSKEIPGPSWSKDKALAYWINAYNAYTVKLILDHYPVKSIKEIHNGEPWDVKWIELAGKTYSLNQIEHDIIRPVYKDPRIHFAVNCAAISCPPLHNSAFTGNTLDKTLDQVTREFINSKKYNSITPSSLELSRIFDWYRNDFGDLTAYIDRYTTTDIQEDASIQFREYDWSLNGK